MTSPTSTALREALAERIREEGLKDYQLESLTRWIKALRDDDERIRQAIELVEVALDATRKGRHVVLWLINQRLRDTSLPHNECVAFLRWVVASRTSPTKADTKLSELIVATSDQARHALLAELDEDRAAAASSLENTHSVHAHAIRAVPHAAWPSREATHREPEPLLGSKGTVRIVLFMAAAVEHLVPRSEKKSWSALLKLAKDTADSGKGSDALITAFEQSSREGALALARAACGEARIMVTRPDMAGASARPAAVRAATLIFDSGGNDAARDFLARLEAELRRLDVVHALQSRKKTSTRPIATALYRGADAKGRCVVWLARLEPTKTKGAAALYGLLAKDGRLWSWTEGPRDEVLATVPDDHFEFAAMAARE